jgi:malate synthase
MKTPNQLSHPLSNKTINCSDLISLDGVPRTITFEGVRSNIDVGICYLEAWLNGNGCVPLHNLVKHKYQYQHQHQYQYTYINMLCSCG